MFVTANTMADFWLANGFLIIIFFGIMVAMHNTPKVYSFAAASFACFIFAFLFFTMEAITVLPLIISFLALGASAVAVYFSGET